MAKKKATKKKASAEQPERPSFEDLRAQVDTLTETLEPYNKPLTVPAVAVEIDHDWSTITYGEIEAAHRQQKAAKVDALRICYNETTESADQLRQHLDAAKKSLADVRKCLDETKREVTAELEVHFTPTTLAPKAGVSSQNARFNHILNESVAVKAAVKLQNDALSNQDRASALHRNHLNLLNELQVELQAIAEGSDAKKPRRNDRSYEALNATPLFRGA